MIRRKFLKATISLVGTGMVPRLGFTSTPCPPNLLGDDNSTTDSCGALGSGILKEAAASLGLGQSVGFLPNTLQRPEDIQWQVQTIWYDAIRKELQYMGKPASSQSQDYSHYIYRESSGSWDTSGKSLFPGTGHVWDVTFDENNGDYWFRKYDENTLRWFDRSDNEWRQSVAQTSPALNSGNPNFASMGWHPNLFGAGQPGVLIWAVFRFFAYNLTSQKFSVLTPKDFSSSSTYWNRSTGQALYMPSTDQLVCFAQNAGNGHPAIVVNAGAGSSTDVIADGLVSTVSEPPIQVYGGGGTSNHGHVVHHPTNANRLLLLEEHGASRVWESRDIGTSWQLADYRHPFEEMNNWSAGEYTVGTIAPYGVVIGMTSNTDGGETVLWKPNS